MFWLHPKLEFWPNGSNNSWKWREKYAGTLFERRRFLHLQQMSLGDTGGRPSFQYLILPLGFTFLIA
jgi:hypothetical protein